MSNSKEAIQYYLRRLHDGDFESAFFGVLELGPIALPDLIDTYRVEADGSCRASLVEMIWQYRDPSVIPFLATALDDEYPEVWKQAIDGLVAIPCDESLQVLDDARTVAEDRREWIEEAIEQIREILIAESRSPELNPPT